MAGVDAGAQYGYAVLLGAFVQLGSQLGVLSLRIGHFLSGSDDIDALFHNINELVVSVLGEGVGAEKYDVCSAGLDHVFVRADDNVLAVALFGLDVIEHGLADLSASADCANDLNAFLPQKHVGHTAAHSAQTPDNYFNFFHLDSSLDVPNAPEPAARCNR